MNDLSKDEYILIKKQDFIDLIDGAKQNDVSTELLEAILTWLEKNNQIVSE